MKTDRSTSNLIYGLRATLTGNEVSSLAHAKAVKHRERAKQLVAQRDSLLASGVLDAHCNADIDPTRSFADKVAKEDAKAVEMEFIGDHVNLKCNYVLEWNDLYKLGVVQERVY